MSFSFLPLPAYVCLCLIGSIYLFYNAISRRNIDRKGLIVLYLTLSIGSILSAIIKVLKETTSIYLKYFDYMGYILIAYCSIILIELFYLSITHKGDAKSKKIILIGWLIPAIPALVLLIDVFFI